MQNPKLETLKKEVKICTFFMIVVPFTVFFYLRSFYESDDPDIDIWPPIGAIIAVQIVIFCIIVWKYGEDCKAVFWDGTGDVPYDPEQRELVSEIRRRVAQKDQ